MTMTDKSRARMENYLQKINPDANSEFLHEIDKTVFEVRNYLNWNEDNLVGDDLIGDKKLTKRFKEIVTKLDELLSKLKSRGGEHE